MNSCEPSLYLEAADDSAWLLRMSPYHNRRSVTSEGHLIGS